MIILALVLSSALSFTNAFLDVSPYELIYGDLTNLESFFALPFNMSATNASSGPEKPDPEDQKPLAKLLERINDVELIKNDYRRHDIQEFNSLNAEVKNITRKYYWTGWYFRYSDTDDDWGVTEWMKKAKFISANMQYLIHSRYKIDVAIRLRNVVRADKRYRLGYLFARMRRLLVEQRKMVATAEENRRSYYNHRLYTIMRLYEKVTRLDVDMRDTAAMIRRVYGESASVDRVY